MNPQATTGIGSNAEAFNDWMIDRTGARWQFWFGLGFAFGLAVVL